MFKHFHASDHVEAAWLLHGKVFCTRFLVVHSLRTGLNGMQLRDLKRLPGEVDAQHVGTPASHGVGQNAPTAADINNTLSLQRRYAFDPAKPKRIYLVQGAELSVGVPPAMGGLGKLGQF